MTADLTRSPRDLAGSWTFSRVIDDRASDVQNTAFGTTDLEVQNDSLMRWFESGTLAMNGLELPFTRTLALVLRDEKWFVTFEDGRDFHPWVPGEDVAHPCGADVYRGFVEIDDSASGCVDRWTVRWVVSGPAKDYTMTTILERDRTERASTVR